MTVPKIEASGPLDNNSYLLISRAVSLFLARLSFPFLINRHDLGLFHSPPSVVFLLSLSRLKRRGSRGRGAVGVGPSNSGHLRPNGGHQRARRGLPHPSPRRGDVGEERGDHDKEGTETAPTAVDLGARPLGHSSEREKRWGGPPEWGRPTGGGEEEGEARPCSDLGG